MCFIETEIAPPRPMQRQTLNSEWETVSSHEGLLMKIAAPGVSEWQLKKRQDSMETSESGDSNLEEKRTFCFVAEVRKGTVERKREKAQRSRVR
jgi:hypothetical protein